MGPRVKKKLKTENAIGMEEAPRSRIHIPEDILFYKILPWIPFTSLCRLKCVCKSWHRVISDDPLFASEQLCRSGSTSSGMISVKNRCLVFLSTLKNPVGVPDPFLSFAADVDTHRLVRIIASTNGLLCLLYRRNFERFLYVCNPATKEGEPIPDSKHKESVGLAFDALSSPARYRIVHPIRRNLAGSTNIVEYRFEVFSSDTMEWIESSQKVTVVDFMWRHSKSVFARGVLYWYCIDYLLWFDCDKDLAGHILLPDKRSDHVEQEIGVWEDRVTCARVSNESVEVWVLIESSGSGEWERRHRVSTQGMVDGNSEVFSSFWHTMTLRYRRVMEGLFDRLWMCPLPFEGGERVFLRVMVRMKIKKYHTREKVLSHDMKTGKVAEFFMGEEDNIGVLFGYRNSLVRLPKGGLGQLQ